MASLTSKSSKPFPRQLKWRFWRLVPQGSLSLLRSTRSNMAQGRPSARHAVYRSAIFFPIFFSVLSIHGSLK